MAERTYGEHNSSIERKKIGIGKIDTFLGSEYHRNISDAKDCITCKTNCVNITQCKSNKK